MICVTRVAKAALEKALAENKDRETDSVSPQQLPIVDDSARNLHQPLIIRVDAP